MVRIDFKKCYVKYIKGGNKLTTCRIGDKSKMFKVDQTLTLVSGPRYKKSIIIQTKIKSIEVKKFNEITNDDLVNESPDCRTVGGLYCVIYLLNKVLLKDNDLVTIIKW